MNGPIIVFALVIIAAVNLSEPQEPVKPTRVVTQEKSAGVGWASKKALRQEMKWYASERELDYLYRTVWGEVRGQKPEEQAAAVHVIINRWQSGRWGGLSTTVLAPRQFSVWNKEDPNYPLVTSPHIYKLKSFRRIAALCDIILEIRKDGFPDPTKGANHYHHLKEPPYWAKKRREMVVGKMRLYRL